MALFNAFERISNAYYHLTAAEKKVADYVIIHQRDTQYMSISELAEACGVAEATVSRFSKRLGYKGYTANLDAMEQTLGLLRPEAVKAAGDLLERADKVLCMGQGGSMLAAQEAAHLFSTVSGKYFPVGDSHMQTIAAAQLGPGDVILFFSFSGSTRDLVELARLARERGARINLVTRFPTSPGAALADVVLQCGANESPLQLGSVPARVAMIFVTDVLFSEVCRRDLETCRAHRRQVADALAEKHL